MATIIKLLLSICIVFSLTGCNKQPVFEEVEQDTYRRIEYNGVSYKYNSHIINFLVMGTDVNDESVGQADFIGLLVFDRENEKISFFSLSRDAYVPIKTYAVTGEFIDWSYNHLALSYSFGEDRKEASYLCADAVSNLLNDIPIGYVASFDLNGIENIHSVVETVDVIVPDDSLEFINSSWREGKKVTLTSDNVELFVRSRDVKEDFTNSYRMNRQKTYLMAFSEKLKDCLTNDFTNTTLKMEDALGDSFTNFDLSEIQAFTKMMMNYQFDNESFYSLPGEDIKGSLHDRFSVDEDALLQLIIELFYVEM